MIIIGQNNDVIINFNQIRGIYIEDLDPEYMQPDKFRIVADGGNAIFPLGRYTTEEKARKVLIEITSHYECSQKLLATGDKYAGPYINKFSYELPVDEEVK